ncbi:MAG: hypothetical protein GF411_00605 [Candidatus Lokiarchaeota archaeon]|nr:hypothetical protein [Candidatus Lokiarchaeota archaeon]
MNDKIENNDTDPQEDESVSETPRTTKRSRRIRNKSYKTLATFIAWSAFVSIWLFFFAIDFTIIENASMVIASLIWFGGMNGVIWTPDRVIPSKSAGRTRATIFISVTWLALLILWFPFFADPFTGYQNTALLIASFVIFIGLVGGMWLRAVPGPIGDERNMIIATFSVFLLWQIFLVIWLWWYAPIYQFEQNVAIGILSSVIAIALIFGSAARISKRLDEDFQGIAEVGLFLTWLLLLVGWFWFFAGDFNTYQNFAIVFISMILFAGIAFIRGRKKWTTMSELEELDFKD